LDISVSVAVFDQPVSIGDSSAATGIETTRNRGKNTEHRA
jgi:hypothetical protein